MAVDGWGDASDLAVEKSRRESKRLSFFRTSWRTTNFATRKRKQIQKEPRARALISWRRVVKSISRGKKKQSPSIKPRATQEASRVRQAALRSAATAYSSRKVEKPMIGELGKRTGPVLYEKRAEKAAALFKR
jgi:hypothetical protein